jgi:hypothetical protein
MLADPIRKGGMAEILEVCVAVMDNRLTISQHLVCGVMM